MERCTAGVSAAVLALACAVCVPHASGQDVDAEFASRFEKAAQMTDEAYKVARDALLEAGREVLPFLRQKTEGEKWAERDLARAMIMRFEQPEYVELCRRVTGWRPTLVENADGTITVKFDPAEAESAERNKLPIPSMDDLALTAECVPVYVEMLREGMHETVGSRVIDILKHFASPSAVPALVNLAGPKAADAVAAVGKPALPFLRETIRNCPTEYARGELSALRPQMTAAGAAALAIAKIGDQEAVPLLIGKLIAATDALQVEPYAEALGRLGDPEAVRIVFDHLIRPGLVFRTGKWRLKRSPAYHALREAMCLFGPAARDFLRERTDPLRPIDEQMIARGLLFDIEHPDDAVRIYVEYYRQHPPLEPSQLPGRGHFAEQTRVEELDISVVRSRSWDNLFDRFSVELPAAFAGEVAVIAPVEDNMRRLLRFRDELPVFDIIADALLSVPVQECRPAALVLAEQGDERTMDVFRQQLRRKNARYHAGELLEPLLLLGRKKAVPLVEEIAGMVVCSRPDCEKLRREGKKDGLCEACLRQEETREMAEAILPILRDLKPGAAPDGDGPATNVRVGLLPALVPLAAGSTGDRHLRFREQILRLGPAAADALTAYGEASEDWREKLLCEALALRLREPALAEAFDTAGRHRTPGLADDMIPSVSDFRDCGIKLAEAVGEKSVALAEAAVAFEADTPDIGIAVFALAHLKQERSMRVIAASLRDYGLYADCVATALAEFGEKSLVHLKTMLERLAPAEEIIPHDKWHNSVNRHLYAARKFHDERLLEAVIEFHTKVAEKVPQELRPWASILRVLAEYEDERVVPICIGYLSLYETHGIMDAITDPLLIRLGEGAVRVLVKTLAQHESDKVRAGAAYCLLSLASGHGWRKTAVLPQQRKQAAEKTKTAVEPLIAALDDKSLEVQKAAAIALTRITTTRDGTITDARPVEPLIAWLKEKAETEPHLFDFRRLPDDDKPDIRNELHSIADYLVKSGNPDAGPALHMAYKVARNTDWPLRALAKIRCTEALPDIIKALDARLEAKEFRSGMPELEAAAAMGGKGLAKVYEIFNSDLPMGVRIKAAEALSKNGYLEAFDAIADLMKDIAAAGVKDPHEKSIYAEARIGRWQQQIMSLARSLVELDRERARPLIVKMIPECDNSDLERALARLIERSVP